MRPADRTSDPLRREAAAQELRASYVSGRRRRPLGIAIAAVLGAATGVVACDDHPGSSSQAATSVSTTEASASTPPSASSAPRPDAAFADAMAAEDEQLAYELLGHHRHHHTGFAGFVFMAFETLGLGTDQEVQIRTIADQLNAKMRPLHVANALVENLLADGIASGNIDKGKVDAEVAKATQVGAEVHPAVGVALIAVHNLLRPEQRQALVDKVDANWALWKQANAREQEADNANPNGYLSHVAKDLPLTRQQVTKIMANLDKDTYAKKAFDVTAADTHMTAFSTAFRADTFDATTLLPVDENTKVVSWGAERMVHFYEAMTSVLTSEQRTKVAEQLREHAREPLAEGTP